MDYLKTNKFEVIWLNSFTDELSYIYNYFSTNLNENSIINKFHRKILKSLSYLSYYPEIYQKINHPTKEIRRIPIDKYVILYSLDKVSKRVFLPQVSNSSIQYK